MFKIKWACVFVLSPTSPFGELTEVSPVPLLMAVTEWGVFGILPRC